MIPRDAAVGASTAPEAKPDAVPGTWECTVLGSAGAFSPLQTPMQKGPTACSTQDNLSQGVRYDVLVIIRARLLWPSAIFTSSRVAEVGTCGIDGS